MRLNRYIAASTGMSRRAADKAIAEGRVKIRGQVAALGRELSADDVVKLDGRLLRLPAQTITIMLNKPSGYVCSRAGQGIKTIYNLLPKELHVLKPIGRLDKDSSGLLLLTNDGKLAHELAHPSYQKYKVYEVELDKPLTGKDKSAIEQGVKLSDGVSKLGLEGKGNSWTVTMSEGRNRQIRRTFGALDYSVRSLHRTQLGSYSIDSLALGKHKFL